MTRPCADRAGVATGGLLAVHAHPDDETLSSGGTIATLLELGAEVTGLTATRGERGEMLTDALAPLFGDGPRVAAHRETEIAAALGPSEGTIKNHVSSILAKLDVRDRVRAVLRGLELGCI